MLLSFFLYLFHFLFLFLLLFFFSLLPILYISNRHLNLGDRKTCYWNFRYPAAWYGHFCTLPNKDTAHKWPKDSCGNWLYRFQTCMFNSQASCTSAVFLHNNLAVKSKQTDKQKSLLKLSLTLRTSTKVWKKHMASKTLIQRYGGTGKKYCISILFSRDALFNCAKWQAERTQTAFWNCSASTFIKWAFLKCV